MHRQIFAVFALMAALGATVSRASIDERLDISAGDLSRVYANVTDAEAYAASFGWPAGLPTVHVAYGEVQVEGADSQFNATRDSWLRYPPAVYWYSADGICQDPCMYIILDPDAPHRADASGTVAGDWGPWLHGIWTDCYMGTSPRCTEQVAYWPPKPPVGNHRYIILLFQQEAEGDVVITSTSRKEWDIKGFLVANPCLQPAAINFFYST